MILIANWKMNLGLNQSIDLAKTLVKKNFNTSDKIVICPDFVSLTSVGKIIDSDNIKLGAQDVFWQDYGSYTGEVCIKTLEEVGCEYVIIGHSERRENLGETDFVINQKIKKIINSSSIIPVICIGETAIQRKENIYKEILKKQIKLAFNNIKVNDNQVIVAYEPIWAIGSGESIKPQDAEFVHKMIYKTIEEIYGEKIAKSNFKIIYGGSVKSNNSKFFVELENINGFLVGGASLDANEFCKIL